MRNQLMELKLLYHGLYIYTHQLTYDICLTYLNYPCFKGARPRRKSSQGRSSKTPKMVPTGMPASTLPWVAGEHDLR